jgi:drug/metabolite transporter (DMT)-like permease
LIFGYEKLSVKTVVGILLGMFGIFLIYQSSLTDLLIPEYRHGIFAILLAILAWAIGTLFMKRGSENSLTMLMNVCVQMLIAGVVLTAVQFYFTPDISTATWSSRSVFAMIYLALFGSVVGYVAFSYLITQLPSTKVVVLSYINLVVALFLGWLILDEKITSRIIIAAAFIISGVLVVNYRKMKQIAS